MGRSGTGQFGASLYNLACLVRYEKIYTVALAETEKKTNLGGTKRGKGCVSLTV
jgi:hypothetical protein